MIVYKATYKCRYCERKFDSKYHYCGLDDAVHHFDSCMKFQPVHFCKGGHVGIGDFAGFERVDIWTKLGVFFGHVLALTMVICAWLIIITVTLKVIWFTLFRILL